MSLPSVTTSPVKAPQFLTNELSSVATPAAGVVAFYSKSGDKLAYIQNSTGYEYKISDGRQINLSTATGFVLTKAQCSNAGIEINMTATGQIVSLPSVTAIDDGLIAIVGCRYNSAFTFALNSNNGYNFFDYTNNTTVASLTIIQDGYYKIKYDHTTTQWLILI